MADDDSLPWGWSLDDLARLARSAVFAQRGLVLDREEAADVAAVGIIEHLYTAAEEPSGRDLFLAGRAALAARNGEQYGYGGYDKNRSRHGRDRSRAPEWARYWYGRRALVSPWEETVIERVALWQVWDCLPERHRDTFTALAEAGTYAGAIESLGCTPKAFERRLSKARLAAWELWDWPLEPSRRIWSPDRPGLSSDSRGRSRARLHQLRQRAARRREESAV